MFCFKHADRSSANEWAFNPTDVHASEILAFLSQIGRSTWGEIQAQRSGSHRRHHEQSIESIDGAAKADLARLRLDEIFGDTMYRFRLSGAKRLWGFRNERIFHIVWWDPNHRVYETEPG